MRSVMIGLLVFALLLQTAVSLGQQQEQVAGVDTVWTGTTEQKLWGLMTVWSEAKYAFPFFDRIPEIDWDAKAQGYIPRVLAAKDMEDYYQVLMEFAALLKDGHTAVNPPWGPFKPGYDSPPIEIQVVEDKFIVARRGKTKEMDTQRIYPGLEILEIGDSIPIQTYFHEHVLRYNSRGTKQADDAINMSMVLSGPQGGQVSLKVKDMDGTVRRVSLTRNSPDRNGKPFLYRIFQWYMVDPVLESKMLPRGILYVRISNFDKPELVQEFQNMIDKLDVTATKGMVIDVRYNPGGESSLAEHVTQCLINRPVSTPVWHIPHYVAADRAWGNKPVWTEVKNTIEPREGRRYLGPLVILTGPGTYSSAEDFVVPLQYSGRAVLVGERTAGSSGNPLYAPLPGGGNFRVVTVKMTYPDGREYVGLGIKPDVEVQPTQEDIFTGNDRVLAKAVEVIRSGDTFRDRSE